MKAGEYLVICAVVLACAGSATAAILYVDPAGGPGTYTSIQPAIDAANDGDEIEVAPGTYTGPGGTETEPALVDFKGKAIRLYSSGGAGVTTIDGTGYSHVVQCVSSEGPATILEGFTITGGGQVVSLEHRNGGGMFNNGSSPTVTDCTFQGNRGDMGGGGMYNEGGNPTVTNCTFQDNSAGDWGGGGMCNSGSSPTVTNCTFRDNHVYGMANGGGMCGGNPTVTNCTFQDNSAEGVGGIEGGGVVTNCTFTGNSAVHGGAMSGGSAVNCTFIDNSSSWTAAGGLNGGSAVNCTFINNKSGFGAGGLAGGSAVNCMFISNESVNGAGGLADGSAVNCTFVNNEAWAGQICGGMVANCIVWFEGTPTSETQVGSGCTVIYSDIKGGFPGEGNIDADPLFVGGGDYHLTPGSPCIDKGTNSPTGGLPSTDMEGNPRSVDGNGDGEAVADMGAYEAPVMTLEELVTNVIQRVLDLGLEPSVTTSLTSELKAALRIITDGNPKNDTGAANILNGFIKTVEAQRGKKIAASDADTLIAVVQQIIDVLSDR